MCTRQSTGPTPNPTTPSQSTTGPGLPRGAHHGAQVPPLPPPGALLLPPRPQPAPGFVREGGVGLYVCVVCCCCACGLVGRQLRGSVCTYGWLATPSICEHHPNSRSSHQPTHTDPPPKKHTQGTKFYLYTGRGPSSEALHLGHLIPFHFTKARAVPCRAVPCLGFAFCGVHIRMDDESCVRAWR